MKHIHFIGICGVGMSALAILWKKKGWKVTGSDVGFYPPISTHLINNKIDFYPGWHPEKMGQPDLVVVGNVAGSKNPEWLFVQKNNISYLSYPELVAKYLIKENSIVCAGTWGKTSTTALLSFILKESNFKPTYMFGGLSSSLPNSADDEGGIWSVLEGDEYKTSQNNLNAKFFSYKPTHLILTGLEWDHFDVYPTEESYYLAFQKLIQLIPQKENILACVDNHNLMDLFKKININNFIKYGQNSLADYKYSDIIMSKKGVQFKIKHLEKEYKIYSPMLGEHMAENICASFAMAHKIGIKPENIIKAISNFEGIKRRLEKRGITKNGTVVFDDIAHSPAKAKSILVTLRKIYSGKIVAIFEPNTGNRQISSISGYENSFEKATEVIIPKLTKIKTNQENTNQVMDEVKLSQVISNSHNNVNLIDDDVRLVQYLKDNFFENDVIVFLGSHSFRGMIDELLK